MLPKATLALRRPTYWFTSDTHFFHSKMADHRGFANVTAMNVALIAAWNSRVEPYDIVFHMGDVSFAGFNRTAEVVRALNGKLHIVPGNHDDKSTLRQLAKNELAVVEPPLTSLKVPVPRADGENDVHRFVLCHFPLLVWNRMHHGAMHLHGHSHGFCRYPDNNRRMDVGVDAVQPVGAPRPLPVSLDQVLAVMATKGFDPVDQHIGDNE
jgi:calcineurin-like phosphoesterase family protein